MVILKCSARSRVPPSLPSTEGRPYGTDITAMDPPRSSQLMYHGHRCQAVPATSILALPKATPHSVSRMVQSCLLCVAWIITITSSRFPPLFSTVRWYASQHRMEVYLPQISFLYQQVLTVPHTRILPSVRLEVNPPVLSSGTRSQGGAPRKRIGGTSHVRVSPCVQST